MDDLRKAIKKLEDWGVLIESVKDEIKKQDGGFLGDLLAPLAASLVQHVNLQK